MRAFGVSLARGGIPAFLKKFSNAVIPVKASGIFGEFWGDPIPLGVAYAKKIAELLLSG